MTFCEKKYRKCITHSKYYLGQWHSFKFVLQIWLHCLNIVIDCTTRICIQMMLSLPNWDIWLHNWQSTLWYGKHGTYGKYANSWFITVYLFWQYITEYPWVHIVSIDGCRWIQELALVFVVFLGPAINGPHIYTNSMMICNLWKFYFH